MTIPKFGIEINFIDNRGVSPQNPKQGPIADLSDGFMTDSIFSMVNLLRETADKLEKMPLEIAADDDDENFIPRCDKTIDMFNAA